MLPDYSELYSKIPANILNRSNSEIDHSEYENPLGKFYIFYKTF